MTQYGNDGRNAAKAAEPMMPTRAVWPLRVVCSVCGAQANIGMYKHTGATVYYCAKHPPDGDAFEVNKFAGVKFYCEIWTRCLNRRHDHGSSLPP